LWRNRFALCPPARQRFRLPKQKYKALWGDTLNISASQQFLELLFGTKPDNQFFLVWKKNETQKTSEWYTTPKKAIERFSKSPSNYQNLDIYIGCGTSPLDRGIHARGQASEVSGIAGFWIDMDVLNPVHKKKNLVPSLDKAIKFVINDICMPTIIINSGHGLQAWWIFNKFWLFSSDEDRRKAQAYTLEWQTFCKSRALSYSWEVDSTHDISRVMRLPGFDNCKDLENIVPVTIEDVPSGGLFSIDLLHSLCSDGTSPTVSNITQDECSKSVGELRLDSNAVPPFDKFEEFKKDPKALSSWERTRSEKDMPDQTASSYDLSLAALAVRASWNDQEIANLLIAARRKYGDDLKLRIDYYRRTIEKARSNVKEVESRDIINELSLDTEKTKDILTPEERRVKILENLSVVFKVNIDKLTKYPIDPEPTYRFQTKQGNIMLPSVSYLIDQHKFREKVATVTGRMLPLFKGSQWSSIAQLLLDSCEIDDGSHNATDEAVMTTWIITYLSEKKVFDDPDKAANSKAPYLKDGKLYIFSTDFQKWVQLSQGERLSTHDMTLKMRIIGAKNTTVTINYHDKHTSRSIWQIPRDIIGSLGGLSNE
jgi:hypothetical protein